MLGGGGADPISSPTMAATSSDEGGEDGAAPVGPTSGVPASGSLGGAATCVGSPVAGLGGSAAGCTAGAGALPRVCGADGCIVTVETGAITTPATTGRDGSLTSPAVDIRAFAAARAVNERARTTRSVAAARLTNTVLAAPVPGPSGTCCTTAPFALPGQPRKATSAPTSASISSAAATRIAVVPRLEM